MKKTLVTVFSLFLILFTSSCLDSGDSQSSQDAVAEIDLTLIDQETGGPLANFDVFILFEVEGFNQPAGFDEFTSDESGNISTQIFSLTSDRITKIILEYEVGDEARSAEKEIDLLLTFEEPYNSISINVELDVSDVVPE